jgi:cysteine desulfurase/selenocysteine lyase
MDVKDLRTLFPALSGQVYGKPLVYFDNAATAERPRSVVDKLLEMNYFHNANIHRAVHCTAAEATAEYENAREKVRAFIGAARREEIVFTSGTTASVNLVASSFAEAFLSPGDRILVSVAEHHSNLVPWQLACGRKGAEIEAIPILDSGEIDLDSLRGMLDGRVKLVAVTHISNVLGIVNPVREIVALCHEKAVPVLIDGAQGIVHESVDVQAIDCDFYAFSGHKMYAATGTGVLYGKMKWLEALPPYMGGGEMIHTVRFSGTTFAPVPQKFEAGTQNISAVPTLVPAVEMVEAMREEPVAAAYRETGRFLYEALRRDPRIRLFGTPQNEKDKIPLFSFAVEGAHHEDLALILDKMGIAVRSGQMCAEPLMDRLGVTGLVRASLAPYNTLEEAEYFIRSLDKAIKMLT